MPQTILIVEDEAFIRLLIQQLLEELENTDIRVVTAEHGQEALDLIQKERPDLVFLDVMSLKTNGFEVCERIRELWNDEAYIVLLTAKDQEFDWQRGMQAGANAYLTRPLDPDELFSLAVQVLGVR